MRAAVGFVFYLETVFSVSDIPQMMRVTGMEHKFSGEIFFKGLTGAMANLNRPKRGIFRKAAQDSNDAMRFPVNMRRETDPGSQRASE